MATYLSLSIIRIDVGIKNYRGVGQLPARNNSLDEKSEGLLLLTTDGSMSEHIRSKSIEKEYYLQISGSITNKAIAALRAGPEIAQRSVTYTTLPFSVHLMVEPTHLGPSHRKRGKSHGTTI